MAKQLSLFDQPTLNILRNLKEAMNIAMQKCGMSPDDVLVRMNELADRYGVRMVNGNAKKLQLATLYKWLSIDDMGRMIPVKALPIFCAATGDYGPLAVLVSPLGGRVIDEKEVKLLEWAKCQVKIRQARHRARQLEVDL